MDSTYVLVLAIALIVALASVGLIRARIRASAAPPEGTESPFAISTEGMKMCSKCGMGNLWTERTCSACGGRLRG
jgi:hypothetical protein